jgi:hypothetical protein
MSAKAEDRFVTDFGEAVQSGSSALFVGAGLSMAAGYPSWRALLKDIAAELNLSANEPDLVALAQYHINENTGNAGGLIRELQRQLGDEKPVTKMHGLLSRLPIDVVWTTNYDRLLERAFRESGKRADVKYTQSQLSAFDRRGDATIFKMHGSVDDPSDIVVAREHYELYGRNRDLFQRLLLTDLLRRTFLFVGLSFTDPNLLNILGWLRATFPDGASQHWALMLPPKADEDEDPALVKRRHDLFVADLRRYGLTVLTMPDEAAMTNIIDRLEAHVSRRAVLVSGSYPIELNDANGAKIRHVSRLVGSVLAAHRLTLVNGFGTTVGGEVISGFLENSFADMEAPAPRMILRPFPQGQSEDFISQYRRDMVRQAGFVAVIGGVRDGAVAPGVLAEVEIARAHGRPIVPIGSTGGAAARLWEEESQKRPVYANALAVLGSRDASPDELVLALEEIVKSLVS